LAFKKGGLHDREQIARSSWTPRLKCIANSVAGLAPEDVYEEALAEELRLRGLKVERQLLFELLTKAES